MRLLKIFLKPQITVTDGVFMSGIEMYTPKIEAIDIFKALRTLKSDELIPQEGAFEFFYQQAIYPGISLFLRHKNRIKLFYIDHDEFILEVKDQVPEWDISIDKNLVRILFNYRINDTSVSMSFVFDISDKGYRDLLEVVRKTEKIKLYYLTMLYGGLVFDSYKKFEVPSRIISVLKTIK